MMVSYCRFSSQVPGWRAAGGRAQTRYQPGDQEDTDRSVLRLLRSTASRWLPLQGEAQQGEREHSIFAEWAPLAERFTGRQAAEGRSRSIHASFVHDHPGTARSASRGLRSAQTRLPVPCVHFVTICVLTCKLSVPWYGASLLLPYSYAIRRACVCHIDPDAPGQATTSFFPALSSAVRRARCQQGP